MKILGLDLSTKTGWSVMVDGDLVAYGLIKSEISKDETHPSYPMNYIASADRIAADIVDVVTFYQPDLIIIEETNKGKNRYSQKILEFIHYTVNKAIFQNFRKIPSYMDTSKWRKLVQVDFNKEEKEAKKDLSKARYQSYGDTLSEVWQFFRYICDDELAAVVGKKLMTRKIRKKYEILTHELTMEALSHKHIKKDGKRLVHISKKHVSVRRVNEVFGTSFEVKDNDICDSICLCLGYYKLVGATHAYRYQPTEDSQDG